MKNTDAYIQQQLSEDTIIHQMSLMKLIIILSTQTVFYGRKWMIYLFLGLLPIFFAAISGDPLFGEDNIAEAFTGIYTGAFMLFLFAIGCLLIALTISSDEINDHQIELYLVRPIRRDAFWIARWLVAHFWIFLVNFLMAFIYYIYYQWVNPEGFMVDAISDLDLLAGVTGLIFVLTFTYGGLYLFIGFLGNRGFTLGVLVAVIESFFISLLFLDNSTYIPRTHYLNFADRLLGSYFNYDSIPTGLELYDSIVYIICFMLAFLIGGAYYLRKKEFN